MSSKQHDKIPSWWTLAIVGFILAGSYEGRSIFNVIVPHIGRKFIEWLVIVAIVTAAVVLEVHKNWKQLLLAGVFALFAHYFFAAEELLHVLFFGSLGASVYRDIHRGKEAVPLVLFGVGICVGDELFQALLPWRFGDPRDIALNLASFSFAFCCLRTTRK